MVRFFNPGSIIGGLTVALIMPLILSYHTPYWTTVFIIFWIGQVVTWLFLLVHAAIEKDRKT